MSVAVTAEIRISEINGQSRVNIVKQSKTVIIPQKHFPAVACRKEIIAADNC